VEFVGESVMPLAYAPAFEATVTVAEGGQTAVQIAKINPAEIRVNVAVMEAFLNRNDLVEALRGRLLHDQILDLKQLEDRYQLNYTSWDEEGAGAAREARRGCCGYVRWP
jgi:hypothetical protein